VSAQSSWANNTSGGIDLPNTPRRSQEILQQHLAQGQQQQQQAQQQQQQQEKLQQQQQLYKLDNNFRQDDREWLTFCENVIEKDKGLESLINVEAVKIKAALPVLPENPDLENLPTDPNTRLYSISFIPPEGIYKLSIIFEEEHAQNSPVTITAAKQFVAKISGIATGRRYFIQETVKVALELEALQPSHIDVTITFASGVKSKRKVDGLPEKGQYWINFTPVCEGPASIEARIKQTGEHIGNSPFYIPLVEPALWCILDTPTRAEMGQQFHFRLKTSFNTRREDFTIETLDTKTKLPLNTVIEIANSENVEEENSDEALERQPLYWNCYFLCETVTSISVTVKLRGQVVQGSPFYLQVEEESVHYTKIRHLHTIVNGVINISEQFGIKLVCNWQTKDLQDIRVTFSCCFLSDLGTVEEIVYEGAGRSSTGAVEFYKLNKIKIK